MRKWTRGRRTDSELKMECLAETGRDGEGVAELEGRTRIQTVESEDAAIGDGHDGSLHFEPMTVSRGMAGRTAGGREKW